MAIDAWFVSILVGFHALEISFIKGPERGFLIRRVFIAGLVLLFVFLVGNLSEAIPQEPEQTISDFSLSGFGDSGKRDWEISAKSADIFRDEIKLDDFVGTFYGQEKIILTADRGDFNKAQNKVHLENNVVITTESGARLTTDYLDWDRNTAEVKTDAPVDIKKDNIVVSGTGIKGDTILRNVDLERDIKLEIDDKKNKIVITCTGPLNINYNDSIAIFNKDVFVDDGQSQMYADSMEVFFEISQSDDLASSFAGRMGRIKKIIARGNVKIVRDENFSLSNEAIYNAADKSLVLTGKPKLIIYSTEEMDASIGN